MDPYMARITLTSKENSISRSFRVKFSISLFDLATAFYASLVKKENLGDYSFLFRFDDVIYLTKKEEQDSLYGYSDGTYHLLEKENWLGIALKNPKKSSFEIIYLKRQNNLVFDIDVDEIQLADGDFDILFLDGKGVLAGELKEESMAHSSIQAMLEKDLKLVKKENRYRVN